ncbi:cell division protein ZapE [Caulobacter sp. S45]|jgi:cell division protein ZapE|uniref:cell division protein ZapE n=1 Tax=Caulobacter sp. S45 TaxID=1641861 RepID=UPI00131BC811|nr:cell division protein ZapE [Caulobacter sp. S45]
MPISVRAAYQERLSQGEITPDAAQAAAVEALARLEGELNALAEPGFSLPFLQRRREAPRGVYLYGPVGRGKSMLMDLFFDSAPVTRKRRVHFHAFMAEIHGLIDMWRKGDPAARKAAFGLAKGDDPIAPTAGHVAGQAQLLCFDEFHVVDIADAMILGRLFEALWARGVVIVATSNRAPDALYENGLNRQLFLPFIGELKARMDVVRVAGPKDFRLDRLKGQQVYFSPIEAETRAAFDALWASLTDGVAETGETLEVTGRKIRLPHTVGGHLRSSFVSLCAANLGAQDYLAVASHFHTVFLEDVPLLTVDRRNEAARFVSLVDALYEAKAKVAVLAEAEPGSLYPAGDGSFEFERTVSRLEEMRSADYIDAARD